MAKIFRDRKLKVSGTTSLEFAYGAAQTSDSLYHATIKELRKARRRASATANLNLSE